MLLLWNMQGGSSHSLAVLRGRGMVWCCCPYFCQKHKKFASNWQIPFITSPSAKSSVWKLVYLLSGVQFTLHSPLSLVVDTSCYQVGTYLPLYPPSSLISLWGIRHFEKRKGSPFTLTTKEAFICPCSLKGKGDPKFCLLYCIIVSVEK